MLDVHGKDERVTLTADEKKEPAVFANEFKRQAKASLLRGLRKKT